MINTLIVLFVFGGIMTTIILSLSLLFFFENFYLSFLSLKL